MAKQDQGYSRSSRSYSGGWGRSRSTETVIREARKDELVDIYIRQAKRGVLDVLGLHKDDPAYDDIAGVIEQDVRQDIADGKMTKRISTRLLLKSRTLIEMLYFRATWPSRM